MGLIETHAQKIIEEYVAVYKPLDRESRHAWFRYTSTGDKAASQRLGEIELAIRTINADRQRFAELKKLFNECQQINDPFLRRQVEILYRSHLVNQVPETLLRQLTKLERQLEEMFSDYRPVVDGQELSPVDVAHLMGTSTDSALLEKVWKAQLEVGRQLEPAYREVVALRNAIARGLGFENAIALAAFSNEYDLKKLRGFYADVQRVTEKPFRKLKETFLDPRLAQHFGIGVAALRPWHYQNLFFQKAPTAIFGTVNLDVFYAGTTTEHIVQYVTELYESMGIPVASILARSSLYPAPGKTPHAHAWYLDREQKDSSVLVMNLPRAPEPPKASEVATLVHELSHDIHFEAILANERLPFLLRQPSMLTEAVAMLFESQMHTEDWLQRCGVAKAPAREAAWTVELIDYVDQLIFLRWASTIFAFEDRLYADPAHDIGDLWWQCRATHQLLSRPAGWREPDALGKWHIANIAPLYYSSYAMGRIANAQFAQLVAQRIGQDPRRASYFNQRDLGRWFMTEFLASGDDVRWDEFIRKLTGDTLSVAAWKKFYLDAGLEARLYQE